MSSEYGSMPDEHDQALFNGVFKSIIHNRGRLAATLALIAGGVGYATYTHATDPLTVLESEYTADGKCLNGSLFDQNATGNTPKLVPAGQNGGEEILVASYGRTNTPERRILDFTVETTGPFGFGIPTLIPRGPADAGVLNALSCPQLSPNYR